MGRYRSVKSQRLFGSGTDLRPLIRICAGNGRWATVRAERSEGLFAVHHDRNSIKRFTVTHGLTGCAVIRGLTRAQALEAFEELNANKASWLFMDSNAPTDAAANQARELHTRFFPKSPA